MTAAHYAHAADPDRCDSCGQSLEVGDWPFCPHGSGDTLYVSNFPGEYWSKHIAAKPVRITSWHHLDQEMRARGLAQLSDFAPTEAERSHVEWSREQQARKRG